MQRKPNPIGFVYKLTNELNGFVYIGATTSTLKIRWNSHKHNSIFNTKTTRICRQMHIIGHEHFTISLIKTCFSLDQLYTAEIYFIKKYQSTEIDKGYNISTGGKISSKGVKCSDESKQKLSKSQRGQKRKPLSDDTKKKISNYHLGRKWSEERKKKYICPFKGKKLSLERRAQISLANQNKPGREIYSSDINGNHIDDFISISEAARKYKICTSGIGNALKGRTKTAGGMIWKYK